MSLNLQVPIRKLAESEGPNSVKAVDAQLANEIALLTAIGKDWAWLAKTSELDTDERWREWENAMSKAANPGELWTKSLRKQPDMMIWWGKIENVQVNGDAATATAYCEDNPRFDHKLKLRRIGGEWKIDVK